MQLSNWEAMHSNPPQSTDDADAGEKKKRKVGEDPEFHNWSRIGVGQVILPMVLVYPEVRLCQ